MVQEEIVRCDQGCCDSCDESTSGTCFDDVLATLSSSCLVCIIGLDSRGPPLLSECLADNTTYVDVPEADVCPCNLAGDITGDGVVDVSDLLRVLATYNVQCDSAVEPSV